MDANTLDLRTFARVARLGSFASAAQELRMSTTAVSRRVANLEEELGCRLLHRTTRRVSLTPAGSLALERAEQLLADLQELKDVLAGDEEPRGHIRITAGVSLGHALLHEALPAFVALRPGVSVELVLTDRPTNLVAERIDLAVRIGKLVDSNLVARRLGSVEHFVCAVPQWLASHGPIRATKLASQPRIVDTNQPRAWHLSGPEGEQIEVEVAGRYAVNNAHAACEACRAGLGLAMLPDFVARPLLTRGALIDALPGWTGPKLGLYAIVLERRWMSAAVRALVEYIRTQVTDTLGATAST